MIGHHFNVVVTQLLNVALCLCTLNSIFVWIFSVQVEYRVSVTVYTNFELDLAVCVGS
jgi:hypothetical protein